MTELKKASKACYCCDNKHNFEEHGYEKQTDKSIICCFCNPKDIMFTRKMHEIKRIV